MPHSIIDNILWVYWIIAIKPSMSDLQKQIKDAEADVFPRLWGILSYSYQMNFDLKLSEYKLLNSISIFLENQKG